MYMPNPNVFEIERMREDYYKSHQIEETDYNAYYNHWRRYVQPFVRDDGSIGTYQSSDVEKSKRSTSTSFSPWNFVGPEVNYRRRNSASDPVIPISWHANVYCIDRSITDPNVLYCGTENGGIYKTTDRGLSWQYKSLNYDQVTVNAIAVDPADENEVLCCADGRLFRSVDGGDTWTRVTTGSFGNRTFNIWQILYHPSNTSLVFIAGEDSLYRSTDGGLNWRGVYSGECQSVAFNPLNSAVVYSLRYDPSAKIPYFQKSLDTGLTFTPKPTGWFSVPPADAGLIESFGGRIAVTEADTSKVYVLLVGSSQSTAQLQLNGQIGIYRSDDGGETWSLPHGLIGAPYNQTTHPNMMTFDGGNSTYNQIYYNTTLAVSQLNANRILIGGMSMWRSNDGGATYGAVGGYLGSVRYVHPDNQEFKTYKTSPTTEEIWVTSDGGINYSTNFMFSHTARNVGIYGAAYWGFDQGWNDDIMVGGRYHNGNAARRDGYPDGEFIQLGGGEAATGYVNYSNEKKTYYSDIDGVVLPDSINGYATSFGMDTDPNESYVDNSSSRILFDWDYWNVAYTGKDNQILKSTTSAQQFATLHTFGTNPSDKVYWIEQSRVNTDIIFVQFVTNNRSQLWRTVDRGLTWSQVTVPQSRREMLFTLSGTDQSEIWIAYPTGSNGNKVYRSTNAGSTWTNITTPVLDNYSIKAFCHQFGTDGGVYAATFHGPVFYRNRTATDWQTVGADIPASSYPLRSVPFYRDNKLRLATWQLGIWETDLFEPSNLIADFSADFKEFYCPGDTVRFVPHAVASANAVYEWQFPGASPSTYTGMYPQVVYQQSGVFPVTLIVTDQGASDTITKSGFIRTVPNTGVLVAEDFENGSIDPYWRLKGPVGAGSNWIVTSYASGFGIGTYSLVYDNFNIDMAGVRDALWTSKCDLLNSQDAVLKFDVAYSMYNTTYSDTLEVAVSDDCGITFSTVYRKGGMDLATAPTNSSALFVPSASEWRTDSVILTNFAGSPEVIIAFINVGRFGQTIYLDNIEVNSVINTGFMDEDLSSLKISPNPFNDHITIVSPGPTSLKSELFDLTGRKVVSIDFNGRFEMDTHSLPSGSYVLRILSESGRFSQYKLIK
ncbi:MAG: T9SS type A sorting domain-containing protein [Bacteroidota bacterium]